jgi:uncharacterized protein (TIGR00725 family)
MEAVSRAFYEAQGRRGLVIGILPAATEQDPTKSPSGYTNPWVEIAIRTHLPWSGERGQSSMSRNHINVLTSDVMIVLPGGAGTKSEALLAVKHGRPVIAYGLTQDPMPLPVGIASTNELHEVQRFVLRALAGRI